MKVAVVGAGVAGLTAAHRLGRLGHECDVYELRPRRGGQAATIDLGDGVLIERHPHWAHRSDRHLRDLLIELGLPGELEWHASTLAVFSGGHSHPLNDRRDLLRYRPLNVVARLRTLRALGRVDDLKLDDTTALRSTGRRAHERLWAPLLRAGFGGRARLSADLARQRTARDIGYPTGTWEALFARLVDRIEAHGGRVLVDQPVAGIAADGARFLLQPGAPGSYAAAGRPEPYDAVIATTSPETFAQLLAPELERSLDAEFRRRIAGASYSVATSLLLDLARPLTATHRTAIADREIGFAGVVEHSYLIDPRRSRSRRFVYLLNVLAPEDPLAQLTPDELLDAYEPGLRRLNGAFRRDWVRQLWLSRDAAATSAPIATGVRGLLLVSYPQERSADQAVRLGGEAAELLLSRAV